MDELLDKLKTMETDVSADRGPFSLFALLLPDGSIDRWDVVVAAPWLEDRRESYDFLSAELVRRLTLDEMITISKIVILKESFPVSAAILKAIRVEHGCIEVVNCWFNEVYVEKGYIITSQRVSRAGASPAARSGDAATESGT